MPQPRIFQLVHKAHSALFRAADRALKTHVGLTTTQQAILFVLRENDGLPITAIANQLNMGKSSLTGLVDRMVDRNYVTRRPSPNDGRSIEICIEPAGRAAVETTIDSTKNINAGLLAPFSNAERQTIERFLHHVCENAETIVDTHVTSAGVKTDRHPVQRAQTKKNRTRPL